MSKVSLRYARALLLASDQKNLEELADDLDTTAEAFGEEQVIQFLENPRTSEEAKEKLIKKVFAGNTLLVNFLKLIVQNKKIREIENIAESFRMVLSEAAGVATARIESAAPLEKKQIAELSAALKKFTGKEIATEVEENPDLIGGVKIHLGDEMIDLSLAGRLGKLGKVLS